jgi:DNA-binding transcriptional MerR regulator
MADQVTLPDDQEQFKLNEVCKLANVQPYMLRFWGTEFLQLEAAKSGTGQRLYSREQVELILEVRRLLFDEGLTIAGARKKIAAADDGGGEAKGPAAEKMAADKKPAEKKTAPRTTSARRKTAKKAATKVDKEAPPDVQPLLATLKNVRDEIDNIVAELKSG